MSSSDWPEMICGLVGAAVDAVESRVSEPTLAFPRASASSSSYFNARSMESMTPSSFTEAE
jgi:hypothetical protein